MEGDIAEISSDEDLFYGFPDADDERDRNNPSTYNEMNLNIEKDESGERYDIAFDKSIPQVSCKLSLTDTITGELSHDYVQGYVLDGKDADTLNALYSDVQSTHTTNGTECIIIDTNITSKRKHKSTIIVNEKDADKVVSFFAGSTNTNKNSQNMNMVVPTKTNNDSIIIIDAKDADDERLVSDFTNNVNIIDGSSMVVDHEEIIMPESLTLPPARRIYTQEEINCAQTLLLSAKTNVCFDYNSIKTSKDCIFIKKEKRIVKPIKLPIVLNVPNIAKIGKNFNEPLTKVAGVGMQTRKTLPNPTTSELSHKLFKIPKTAPKVPFNEPLTKVAGVGMQTRNRLPKPTTSELSHTIFKIPKTALKVPFNEPLTKVAAVGMQTRKTLANPTTSALSHTLTKPELFKIPKTALKVPLTSSVDTSNHKSNLCKPTADFKKPNFTNKIKTSTMLKAIPAKAPYPLRLPSAVSTPSQLGTIQKKPNATILSTQTSTLNSTIQQPANIKTTTTTTIPLTTIVEPSVSSHRITPLPVTYVNPVPYQGAFDLECVMDQSELDKFRYGRDSRGAQRYNCWLENTENEKKKWN